VIQLTYLGTIGTDQNYIHKYIKSRFNWGQVATIKFRIFPFPKYGKMRNKCTFSVGKPKGDHLEDLGIDGRRYRKESWRN
jgi:hypothetical protein